MRSVKTPGISAMHWFEQTKILRTCHNIIRNNDKLSPEAAFDEISKILFMKIKYEREQRGAKVFTKNIDFI